MLPNKMWMVSVTDHALILQPVYTAIILGYDISGQEIPNLHDFYIQYYHAVWYGHMIQLREKQAHHGHSKLIIYSTLCYTNDYHCVSIILQTPRTVIMVIVLTASLTTIKYLLILCIISCWQSTP